MIIIVIKMLKLIIKNSMFFWKILQSDPKNKKKKLVIDFCGHALNHLAHYI